jgi:hypothetical protein
MVGPPDPFLLSESADTPIQYMIGEVPSSEARPAWHAGGCIETSISRSINKYYDQEKTPDPFSST